MENVIRFPQATTDGGKVRIKARRDALGLGDGAPGYQVDSDSLVMLRADVDTTTSDYVAPAWDPA